MVKDFDWTEDINSMDVDTNRASNKGNGFKYNPELTDEMFNEVRSLVTKLWSTYDNKYGYVDEKMAVVNSCEKTWTDVIKMIRMWHHTIQSQVIFPRLSKETNEAIKLEMYDRGWTARDF
jgi:hypothetical protein